MKKYLLGLLDLRLKELTNKINQLENRKRSATATGLSGFNANVEEIRSEMNKVKSYKEKLEKLNIE